MAKLKLEEHVSLARYSTLHVGGAARYFTRVVTKEQLKAALDWAGEKDLPIFVLGGGTNFFCRDEGFQGLVIKMENRRIEIPNVQFPMSKGAQREVTAEAGMLTRLMVLRAVEQGLRGVEHLAGIPGTIGGAVRGNAGSFGTETKDALARAVVLTRAPSGWEEEVLSKEQLSFSYRDSLLKRSAPPRVVWSATFALESGDRADAERLVAEDLAARKAKQPYDFPSVGSVFKNPPSSRLRGAGPSSERAAGKLVEAAGFKGRRVGGAEVSLKHANFIVNRGGATATDVMRLIEEIKRRVHEKHGVSLEEEIIILR